MTTPFTGAHGSAVSDLRARARAVTFDAGAGSDPVLGSVFADSLIGGAASNSSDPHE